MQYCQHCGAEDAEKYCGTCGRPQGDNTPRSDVDYDAVENEANGPSGDTVYFEGTTWPLGCLSPMFCNVKYWRVSSKRIDLDHGCCRSNSAVVDMRRVKDIALRRNPFQWMINRGTVVVYTDADPHVLRITKQRAMQLYKILVEVSNVSTCRAVAGVCTLATVSHPVEPTIAPLARLNAILPPHLASLTKQNSNRVTGITG